MSFGSEIKKGSEWRRIQERERRSLLLTKIPILDRLSGSGLSRGTLIELCGGASGGHWAVALAVLAAATGAGESAALVDPGDHLDPQGAESAGVDLARLLWVRPPHLKEALMSTEMILSSGFSLVVLDLALETKAPVPPAVWIRLSRAARAQQAVLLILHPAPLCGTAADTVVVVRSATPIWLGSGSVPRLLAGLSVDLTARKRHGGRQEASATLFLSVDERRGYGMPEGRPTDGMPADRLSLRS